MPDTTKRSTSLHLRGAAEAGTPRLAGLPGVHREEPSPVEVLEVERYDTDDLRLAAAGITLALHRGGGPAHWRLALPDGEDDELQQQLQHTLLSMQAAVASLLLQQQPQPLLSPGVCPPHTPDEAKQAAEEPGSRPPGSPSEKSSRLVTKRKM